MGQERTQGLTRPVDPGEDGNAHLARLRGLLRAAASAQGEARRSLAGEVNQVLAKIREPGNESDEARVLVAELDAHAFDELIDARGVSARKEAVQTLLSLGFPHALQVDPGDLAYARKEETREKDRQARAARLAQVQEQEQPEDLPSQARFNKRLQTTRTVAAFLAGLSSLALLGLSLATLPSGSTAEQLVALFQALLSGGSAAYLATAMPRIEEQALPITGMVFGAVLSLFLLPSVTAAALIGLVGTVAALIVLIGWQYDDPGRHDGLFPPDRGDKNPFDDSGG